MTNDELYLALSELVNNNSKEIEYRMDTMEERLNNRMDGLDAKIDNVEEKLSGRIDSLDSKIDTVEAKLSGRIDSLDAKIGGVEKSLGDQIRNINMCLENIIEPRLQNIEMCYVTTFERYKVNNEKFERMQLDIDVLKSVVRKHDEILCATPA